MKTFYHNPNTPKLAQSIRVDSEQGRYYTTPSGLKVPSITTVLGSFAKQGLEEWKARVGQDEANRIARQAGVRGTKFHSLMEAYINNQPIDLLRESTDMAYIFRKCKKFVDRIDNIRHIEAKLFSEKLKVAGTTDIIADFDFIPSIIDFKTSLKTKKECWIQNYFEQATAYSLMYEEMTGIIIPQIVIIIGVDEKDSQLFVKTRDGYIDQLKTKLDKYHNERQMNVS